ncbi:MAG: precorrin-6A/cobalt-precorrin-6A reductase, partial [Boseongicola sp.]|nr:precorrin-6A/cobalt-precorrin-6A reductase [Boseongicola sp.]
ARPQICRLRGTTADGLAPLNSGGVGSWPKVEAARELGIRVAMIRRPLQPEALRIDTVAEALAWVRRRL